MKKKKKSFRVLDLWDAGTEDVDTWNKRIDYQFKGDAKEYTRALKAGINFLDKRFSRTAVMAKDYEKYLDVYNEIKNTKISNTSWNKNKDLTNKWRNFLNDVDPSFANSLKAYTVETLEGRTYVNLSNSIYSRTGNLKKRKRKGKTNHERIANHNEVVAAWKLYKILRDNGEDVDLKTGIADFISPYMLALVSIYENTAGHRLNIITDIEEHDTGETYRAVSFKFTPRVLKELQKIAPKIEKEEKEGKIRVYTNKYENFRKLPKKRNN